MNLIRDLGFYITFLICTGNGTPVVPRNNSHYVEGSSRYIWMSDDDVATHLVDLQERIDTRLLIDNKSTDNQYWLFTRTNPNNPQRIIPGDVISIEKSNYAAGRPLKVVVHGWRGSLTSRLNSLIASALLAVDDVNVIVVDWSTVADSNYLTAAANTPAVGEAIGHFVVWLVNTTNANWDYVHLIGFSLGAHAVGSAGRIANGRPRRVTGLDPAGPGWYINSNTLNFNAGRYVEIIHTDIGVMGLLVALGHVNFYPNGGLLQPGCDTNQCSHSRAWELFASSVRTNHFIGRLCSDVNEAINNQCTGSVAYMGNSILDKQGGLWAINSLYNNEDQTRLFRQFPNRERYQLANLIFEEGWFLQNSTDKIAVLESRFVGRDFSFSFMINNVNGIYGLRTGSSWPF